MIGLKHYRPLSINTIVNKVDKCMCMCAHKIRISRWRNVGVNHTDHNENLHSL